MDLTLLVCRGIGVVVITPRKEQIGYRLVVVGW